MPTFFKRPSKTVIAISVILATLATFVFLELADDVWMKEGFRWDAPLMLAIHQLSSPLMDAVVAALTTTGGRLLPVIFVAVAVYLWHRRQLPALVSLVISLGGSLLINTVLKAIFARPRPQVFPPITVENTFSFPSGHTMAAVAFYGLLAVFLWEWGHRTIAMLTAGWVPVVAVTRVYLGVHYPSDVLGALAVGFIWLIVMAWAHRSIFIRWYSALQIFRA